MTAPAFPEPWGLDQITGNSTNIFNASVIAWQSAGTNHIVSNIVFGMIPLLLLVIVYIRTQQVAPAVFVSMFSLLILYLFGLVNNWFALPIAIIEAGLVAIFFWNSTRNRR